MMFLFNLFNLETFSGSYRQKIPWGTVWRIGLAKHAQSWSGGQIFPEKLPVVGCIPNGSRKNQGVKYGKGTP